MKILFISFNDITDEKYGGGQCSRRNLELLKKYGNVDFVCIRKKSNLESIKAIIFGNFPPLTRKKEKEILDTVKKENYPLIFLDSSLLGSIGKSINKFNNTINVFTFFHNVEYDYTDVRIGKGLKHFIYKQLAKKHEGYSLVYSDKIIVLNGRDNNRLKQVYNREADCILPISFADKYIKNEKVEKAYIEKPIALFVGSFGRANYEGIKWFIQNSKILDMIELQVVGKGFDCVRDELESFGCKVLGTVDDISTYYGQASFVISPILFGGGMKVKIAEALMYGKTVFGTDEALEGYEDEKGVSLYHCNNIEEFDDTIQHWISCNNNRFNEDSRKLFLNKYNSNVIKKRFDNIMTVQ